MGGLFIPYLIVSLLVLLVIICDLSNKENKYRKYYILFYIIVLSIIILFNSKNQDTISYLSDFKNVKLGIFPPYELGFSILMWTFSTLNIPFLIFQNFVILFSILLFYSVIAKYSKNKLFVVFLMFIFPFFLNMIQLRFLLASAIVCFAISSYINDKKKIYYILYIFSAFLVHSTSIIFIFLPILINIKRKVMLYISGSIFLISFLMIQSGSIEYLASMFMSSEKIYYYFTYAAKLSDSGILIIISLQFIFPLLIAYFYRDESDFQNGLINLNLFLFSISPLILLSFEFTRLPRATLLLNYILWGNIILNEKILKKRIFMLFIFILQVVFSWYALQRWGIFSIFLNNYLL